MKKFSLVRIISFVLLLVLTLTTIAIGQTATYENEAKALQNMGLLQGSDKGFELERAPNRVEAGVMLIRLLGKENEVLRGKYSHPFKDVPSWADPYVGYMYTNNLTQGVGAGRFGSNDLIDAKSYMTFVLRALGYDDSKGDFSWDKAITKGKELQIIDQTVESQLLKTPKFLRGDMVFISYNSLGANIKGQNKTLKEKLISEGVIKEQQIIKDEEKSKDIVSENIGTKIKITLSDYEFDRWGSAIYRIDRGALPPEIRGFAYVVLSGSNPKGRAIDLSDFIYSGDIERHKRIMEGDGEYSSENGNRYSVYSGATLMYLYGENQEPVGYGYWEGEKREGTFEVEIKPWIEFKLDIEQTTSGVTVTEDAKLFIDRSKLPPHIKNFTKVVFNSRYEENPAFIKREALNGQLRGQINYTDEGIDLISASNNGGNWADKFILYLYDKENNILGYSVISSNLVNESIRKEVDKANIQEVSKGVVPFYNPITNGLEVTVIREKLPEELRNVSTMFISSKPKTGELNSVVHMYLNNNEKKEHSGGIFNSSGLYRFDVNFNINDYYILLFDSNKNLIGYHLVSEKDAKNNDSYFRSLYMELEGETGDRLRVSDFNIKRYINGKEDKDFNNTGGSSFFGNRGGKITFGIYNMFYEEGISYEVTPKDNKIKVKSITLE